MCLGLFPPPLRDGYFHRIALQIYGFFQKVKLFVEKSAKKPPPTKEIGGGIFTRSLFTNSHERNPAAKVQLFPILEENFLFFPKISLFPSVSPLLPAALP